MGHYALPNASLQLAYESMEGHIANLVGREVPEAWDAVVLQPLALLSAPQTECCPKTKAIAALASLVAVDLYCWAIDVLFILPGGSSLPTGRNIISSQLSTITSLPNTGTPSSKKYIQDQTLVVSTHALYLRRRAAAPKFPLWVTVTLTQLNASQLDQRRRAAAPRPWLRVTVTLTQLGLAELSNPCGGGSSSGSCCSRGDRALAHLRVMSRSMLWEATPVDFRAVGQLFNCFRTSA